MKNKKRFTPLFKKNKKNNHPSYVYNDIGKKYKYIGITHSKTMKDKTGNIIEYNIPLEKNPDPSDNRQSYIRPYPSTDYKNNFGRTLHGWSFSKLDKKKVGRIKKNSK